MIKISHECPVSLLNESLTFNDYDYCLVHLLEENIKYRDFYLKSVKNERHVLLDCSIFELGTAFDAKKYIQWILELNPTEFIIPDVLEDSKGTIDSAQKFLKMWYPAGAGYYSWSDDKGPKLIGVVQGKSYKELVTCYRYMDKEANVGKIAISFDYSYYREEFPHPNKWVSFMMGRVAVLTRLLNDGIINTNKPHHLLGCAHPREFSFYTGPEYNWIDTLDTSSPIVHGIKGIIYENKIGTWQKESTKLADLLTHVPTHEEMEIIKHNIREFKKYTQ